MRSYLYPSYEHRLTAHLGRGLRTPVPALRLDLFRVAIGCLGFAYFVRLILETPDFSSPHGLLDHDYLTRVLWFTRWSLFQPGMPEGTFYFAYGLGAASCLGIVAGIQTKPLAGLAFLIAASHYRWNFVVLSVDDSIVHLLFFWLLLLPVGRTLRLADVRRRGLSGAWSDAAGHLVPGFAVRLLTANVCLIYLTAGLAKLGWSELWRSGFALYAILRQPISYAPDLWQPASLAWLVPLNYAALAAELALPFMLLGIGGRRGKALGLALAALFHVGILVTLKIPFANLGMLAAMLVVFAPELGRRLGSAASGPVSPPVAAMPLLATERMAICLIVLLAMAMLRGVPFIGSVHRPAFATLWAMGLAQDYQLFKWVDGLNYHARNQVVLEPGAAPPRELAADEVLPRSMRHVLLQAQTVGIRWMPFPRAERPALRAQLRERLSARACRVARDPGRLVATVTLQRITPDNLELRQGRSRIVFTSYCGRTT